jgi:hypothetical protein
VAQTNEEFMSDLMNFSAHGGMVQVFILNALLSYSKAVAESTPKPEAEDLGLVTEQLWNAIAKEVHGKVSTYLTPETVHAID